uniref:UPF0160 protein MYG1, mitochondrial n=1 Tax=Panagrellus redivivus TaxID=6233 RepID=A0A7E4V096_PANRE
MARIGTHDGKFHTDEVLACFFLRSLEQYKNAPVIRSRNPEVLETCDIVVDVGGVYDPKKLKFDHHQREFNETMKSLGTLDFDTKLSSAGLVYNHFGREVIASLLKLDSTQSPVIDVLYAKMYENFVHAVDAIDNGIEQFDGPPRYKLSSTLNSRVGNLNPAWNQEDANPETQFDKAMKVVGREFTEQLSYLFHSFLPARQLVLDAIENREKNHISGKIVVFANGSCPWKEHLLEIEAEQKLQDKGLTYAVFGDKGGSWRVQAIPVDANSTFENRAPLPEAWRGFRDEKLSDIVGVPDCVFVHISGFIGGHKTREGAIQMAEKALILLGLWSPRA